MSDLDEKKIKVGELDGEPIYLEEPNVKLMKGGKKYGKIYIRPE
jgi:hypothetical protein